MKAHNQQKPKLIDFYTDVLNMKPVGSLRVFVLEKQINGITQIGAPENGFYWTDKNYPERVGPFISAGAATRHYVAVVLHNKEQKKLQIAQVPVKTADIIYVDFRMKKRIEPSEDEYV